MLRSKVRVAHRHFDPLVTEEGRHRSDIHARHDEIRREGVSQVVEAEILIFASC
jgi:hypothetical protein